MGLLESLFHLDEEIARIKFLDEDLEVRGLEILLDLGTYDFNIYGDCSYGLTSQAQIDVLDAQKINYTSY